MKRLKKAQDRFADFNQSLPWSVITVALRSPQRYRRLVGRRRVDRRRDDRRRVDRRRWTDDESTDDELTDDDNGCCLDD